MALKTQLDENNEEIVVDIPLFSTQVQNIQTQDMEIQIEKQDLSE